MTAGNNPSLTRRKFLESTALAACAASASRALPLIGAPKPAAATEKADFTVRIAPASFEIARGKTLHTIAYNGQVPGPLLRMKEGVPVVVDVYNETDHPDIVHWHGQMISSQADGSVEEGSPLVPARGHRRYHFTPKPAGCRWYHSHAFAGKDLHRSLFTGQFGFVFIEPKNDPGRYDREVFLTMHQWEPFFTTMGEDIGGAPPPPNNGLEIGYHSFSFNDKALGHGEPVRVREAERILFHLLNASATETVNVALASHSFTVVALDGNPVPAPQTVPVLQVGPAERVDAIVTMNSPGIWIMGTTDNDDRQHGFGVVIEYANRHGAPGWTPPKDTPWDYTSFGNPAAQASAPEGQFELVIKKIPGGHGGFNRWTINGKSFPKTDPLMVQAGKRYRLIFNNQSDDAHPLHLHRHSFELTKVGGKATAGVVKDVVMVDPYKTVEVDFTADNPGDTLLHCHQQLHMDFGFMNLVKYR
jgi:FtsP/CotA-like multicopper oxidase with cupredoxin domain